MAKPSIFSRNYEKAMKRRRRIIISIIISIILIIGIIIYISIPGTKKFNTMNKLNKKNITGKTNNKNNKNEKIELDKNKQQDSKINTKKDIQDKYLTLQLNENLNIKITYTEEGNKKIYKELINSKDNSNIYYDISPSKTSLLVLDAITQKIYFLDNDGNISDISKEKYVSKKGDVFYREYKIKNNKNYVWCETPRFIDDNNIAFISQLPWLKEDGNKFIWFGDIQKKKYRYIKNKSGTSVEFENLNKKGLVVSIDKEIYYIKANGEIIQ